MYCKFPEIAEIKFGVVQLTNLYLQCTNIRFSLDVHHLMCACSHVTADALHTCTFTINL